jgi:hypothetical protein
MIQARFSRSHASARIMPTQAEFRTAKMSGRDHACVGAVGAFRRGRIGERRPGDVSASGEPLLDIFQGWPLPRLDCAYESPREGTLCTRRGFAVWLQTMVLDNFFNRAGKSVERISSAMPGLESFNRAYFFCSPTSRPAAAKEVPATRAAPLRSRREYAHA